MAEYVCEWEECGAAFYSQTHFEKHLKKHVKMYLGQGNMHSKIDRPSRPTHEYFQCTTVSEDEDDCLPRPEVLLSPFVEYKNYNATGHLEQLTLTADPTGETVIVFCSLCESFYKKFPRSSDDPFQLKMQWYCQFCRPPK